MKRIAPFLLAILIILAIPAAVAFARTSVTYEDSRATAPHVVTKGGPIRLGTSVYAHANSTHAVVGITSVTATNCSVVITHDWEPGERVIAAVAEEDETLSKLGIQAGISGGGEKSTVYLYRDGAKVCPTADILGTDVANLWVSVTTVKP